MKNLENLKKKLEKMNFDKYQYWDNVMFAVHKNDPSIKTALVFNIYNKGNETIIDCLDDNTPFYIIKDCIESGCERLGFYDYSLTGFCRKIRFLDYE